ncbi:DUF3866 family protein [Arcanobacterium bovis]|uniref:DUF3866 family protein n=1 Tax=Arcanobacterium bovis TaxID=2529275 RepID=A0A4Q9V2X0_9ACTO|nr:DUF3866 family protein [Arcanobacterium bovis]TBW22927.1 DUF3866 family protein [Arcanobacterium bovis]
MIIWRQGKITQFVHSWGDAGEYHILLDDGTTGKALAYYLMVGTPEIGDTVLVSAAAVKRGLGTGGYMFVVAIPDRLPADPPPHPGHIVKNRYSPTQYMVQGVDEQESAYHHILADAQHIDGMHVIGADLHSALPAIVGAIREKAPHARIAYVMGDGGALPAWFSQLAYRMRENGDILGTISCGQAFGGDLEAVNIYTGLLAAKHVWDADVAVIAQGPGNLGTGTRWGFSGTSIGEALNAAGILGGTPVAALRMSEADQRDRHFGISHHSMRILQDIVTHPCIVPTPALDACYVETKLGELIDSQLEELKAYSHLNIKEIDSHGLCEMLENSPYSLRTMGRNLSQDTINFIAAAAAGRYVGEELMK